MITLAGLVPDDDIEIRIVGVRPGEKLFEELSLDAECLLPTNHNKIRIFQSRQVTFGDLVPWIAELQHLLWRGDSDAVIAHLRALVPEYHPLGDLVPVGAAQPASQPTVVPEAAAASVYTA
jgi:FlaA1/EpsC-like NDP-sugar epimerase